MKLKLVKVSSFYLAALLLLWQCIPVAKVKLYIKVAKVYVSAKINEHCTNFKLLRLSRKIATKSQIVFKSRVHY